jgi:intraflagellar transport protein 172
MQLRHLKTIQPPAEMQEGKFQKISAFAWSPNHLRLAAAGQDRYIVLYDENGEQKDKFPTKPAEKKGSRNYVIRSLEFSPDSTRLAVAQSDCIVFVYKLGTSWTDKKTISNKFPQLAPVTCMCWPSQRFGELVYGCSDGKIGVGKIKTNRSQILYSHESYCVGMAASPDGNSFVTAFLDGSIIKFTFPPSDTGSNPLQTTLVQTNFVPSVLSWGEHIVVAGNTGKVLFYNSNNGRNVQTFDYSDDLKLKEFTSAAASPSGQTMILGNFNRFFVYVYNMQRDGWDEAGVTTIQNFYSVTGLRWKCDGSRLVTGSLCGAIDMYDACIRRFIYAQKFEFTYTSLSTVIIRRLQNSTETSISSRYGLEIKKIDIYSDRYLVAKTPDTLLLCDTETKKLSEIHWTGSGKEKYFFDTPSACLIFNAGELSVVEYGSHEILGHCSTVHMSPHLISVRLGEARNKDEKDAKKIAYLLDSLTIRLLDLTEKSASEVTISHDSKIDWLELNQRGTKLLFRDKRRTLHLFDALTQTRKTLLNFCNYVQWVPDADVVVAQSRRNLYCWYSIESTSDVVITPIKGDIEEIERSDGKTEVIVDEGIDHASYRLDETLISFGAAADAKNFQKCVSVLESLGEGATNLTSMWEQLANLAKANNDFAVSQRCAAALGNMGLTYALSKVNETILASGGDTKSVDCLAQVAILNQQFKRAENILVQQGKVNAAIMMYLRFHKWEEAMIVAQSNHHPRLSQIRNAYFQYLVKTKQANVAGELKEKEGEYSTALRLYLSEGYPTKAADLVIAQDMTDDTNLCQNVAQALLKQKAFEKAGHFYDTLRFHQQALDAYVKGHCYTQALDLARRAFPGEVVRLEQEFGDWLVSHKQMDAACNHYIQAGAYLKAINAAIEARQWVKAVQIIDQMDSTSAKPYYKRIAKHYVEVKDYENAERYFIQGNLPVEAVTMYTTAQMWDKAHQIASTYMPPAEVTRVYVTLAQDLEARGTAQAKDAERLYLTVKEPDLAISMYKRNRQYDDMLRLIESNRKELLEDTHMHLGNQYEIEGNFKQAEQHFLRANDWKAAVNMYRENELWEDCLRVAKARGGDEAYKQMAYAFAMSVGGDQGAKILQKRGLAEHAVDYAIDRGEGSQLY